VARATLYFPLRYPGLIGDTPQALSAERLALLQEWHGGESVNE
jgi:endonuclease G, mitochondrial